MASQFLKFLVNGIALGLAAWAIQAGIFFAIGVDSNLAYGAATALTYAPLIALNFQIQRRWIFRSKGRFWRFLASHLSIMAFVSVLSPVCRLLITHATNPDWGNAGGFVVAALIGSIFSFFLQREWVFRECRVA
jgi:putative flippase GtrA